MRWKIMMLMIGIVLIATNLQASNLFQPMVFKVNNTVRNASTQICSLYDECSDVGTETWLVTTTQDSVYLFFKNYTTNPYLDRGYRYATTVNNVYVNNLTLGYSGRHPAVQGNYSVVDRVYITNTTYLHRIDHKLYFHNTTHDIYVGG